MARVAYRCMKCRTRNAFRRPIETYRQKKCKACGHTRFYYDKERNRKQPSCECQGYHFPHRPGSRFCRLNPLAPVWEVERRGGTWLEVCATHFEVMYG